MHASKGTREETGGAASGLRTGEQRMSGSGTAQKNIPADEILVMLCADLRLPHRGCASDYCRVAVDVINHHFPGIRARHCPPYGDGWLGVWAGNSSFAADGSGRYVPIPVLHVGGFAGGTQAFFQRPADALLGER